MRFYLGLFSIFFLFGCSGSGPFDLRGKQPVVLVENEESKLKVEGFNHEGSVYSAEIDLTAVREAYFVITQFAKIPIIKIAHTMVVFRVERRPVVLRAQGKRSIELGAFVYSFNFVGKKDQEYNPIFGAFPNYRSSHNLRSPQDLHSYVSLNDEKLGRASTRVYKILYSEEEAQKLALSLIQRGSEAGVEESYNTIYRNCSSVVFHEMDEIRSHSRGRLRPIARLFSQPLTLSPARAHLALSARGLLGPDYLFSDFWPLIKWR